MGVPEVHGAALILETKRLFRADILIGTEVEEGRLSVQPRKISGILTWPFNLKGFICGHRNAVVADS